MLYDFLLMNTVILIAAPLFVYGLQLGTYDGCSLFFVGFGLIFRQFTSLNRIRVNKLLIDNTANVFKIAFLFVAITVIGAYFFTFIGLGGLTNRDLIREDYQNYNFGKNGFLEAQIDYFKIVTIAALFGYSLKFINIKLFILASVLSSFLLTSTGTRWYWLLAVAPVLVFFIVNVRLYVSIFIMALSFIPMLLISANRGSGNELTVDEAAYWDIPTFQSYEIIERIPSDITNIVDFINGQLLILIPRFLWPDKPLDNATTNYMIGEIGDAFDYGATILPGIMGSSWLYGGVGGIILFTALFFSAAQWIQRYYFHVTTIDIDYASIGLSFFGLILQSRGISVFYLIPFVYYFLFRICIISIGNKFSELSK